MAKQLSVQQQNQRVRAEIQRTAAQFKTPLAWLDALLAARGLEPNQGLLVRIREVPEQGGGSWLQGIWLTEALVFWEFEVVAAGVRGELWSIEEFKDVTATTPIEQGHPGTGRTFGWLASEVLRERGA